LKNASFDGTRREPFAALRQRARTPIEIRKAERELFFWTARETVKLIVLAALAVYVVISLIEGQLPGSDLLARAM
jgi:hypothetical protein